jgi:hypothetical protein
MTKMPKPARYQLPAYNELRELAADYFDYDWQSLPITPRTNVLICGSSGVGKTFLGSYLARELRLPILNLDYGSWVVTGARARGGLQTLQLLYRFIEKHQMGLIALDEIDKMGTESTCEWTRAVHLELFSVLDKRLVPGIIEGAENTDDGPLFSLRPEDIQRRFARGFFVLGSGAWHHLWRASTPAGFGTGSGCSNRPTYDRLLRSLRPEILSRFRSAILFLGPLQEHDDEALLEETVHSLPHEFGPLLREAAAKSLSEAVETQKGYRWIEELVTDAIRVLRVAKSHSLSLGSGGESIQPAN